MNNGATQSNAVLIAIKYQRRSGDTKGSNVLVELMNLTCPHSLIGLGCQSMSVYFSIDRAPSRWSDLLPGFNSATAGKPPSPSAIEPPYPESFSLIMEFGESALSLVMEVGESERWWSWSWAYSDAMMKEKTTVSSCLSNRYRAWSWTEREREEQVKVEGGERG